MPKRKLRGRYDCWAAIALSGSPAARRGNEPRCQSRSRQIEEREVHPPRTSYGARSSDSARHPQLGLCVPSQHCARPPEQPQTPSCQEQQPDLAVSAVAGVDSRIAQSSGGASWVQPQGEARRLAKKMAAARMVGLAGEVRTGQRGLRWTSSVLRPWANSWAIAGLRKINQQI